MKLSSDKGPKMQRHKGNRNFKANTVNRVPYTVNLPQGIQFTLIELLVVIAIIAILAAILLPVLGKAKDVAKFITCINQMRQQHLTLMAYANDNASSFPQHKNAAPDYVKCPNGGVDMIVPLDKYITDPNIMYCPTVDSWIDDVNGDYGGWNTGANYITMSYFWLASYEAVIGWVDASSYGWEIPYKTIGCYVDVPFISHRNAYLPSLGTWQRATNDYKLPALYADGHGVSGAYNILNTKFKWMNGGWEHHVYLPEP
jgi:prepilin-type N-terminal cleavage/methylation domain-containing protein